MSLVYPLRWGAHIQKYPTFKETIDRVLSSELCSEQNRSHGAIKDVPTIRAFQLYISSNRSYGCKVPNEKDAEYFKNEVDKRQIYMCIHGCLLYNLCGSPQGRKDPQITMKLNRTIVNYTKELDIGVLLGDRGVVIHTGTCKNYSEGIELVGQSLIRVLTEPSSIEASQSKEFRQRRRVLIENCAGEGTKLGKNLREVRDIINSVPKNLRRQIKVVIDTCHSFAAGDYNFGKVADVHRFFKDFDELIGLEKLEALHLNDSKAGFGGKLDRHANLGFGKEFVGEEGPIGLRTLMEECHKHSIPAILETPGTFFFSDIQLLTEIESYLS